MSASIEPIHSTSAIDAASLTTFLLSSTLSTSTQTTASPSAPRQTTGSYDVQSPSKANTKQTVILSVVFAGWAVVALVLFVLVARRRGKLTQDREDLEAMLAEQQTQGLRMHTTAPYAHQMPLGIEYRPTRHMRQLPVLKASELALLPVIPASQYLGKINAGQDHQPEKEKEKEEEEAEDAWAACVVCLERFQTKGDSVRVLGCGHGFHPPCIDKWLLKRSCRCPLCNHDTKSALALPAPPSAAKLAAD
ncbi:hypothetical protein H4217_007860 [Coemansia sp. RSA 1939]|nr:hypothetical protein H4217_007860 [Coemansia sp. RSA 1939]KAJ2591675.1 hypothetical protein EV177_008855 [Coemansia sp. RSA 1804]KAJ2683382.1 hypothetical protein GGH99_004380 [Coemansia sp. RSA 1285]